MLVLGRCNGRYEIYSSAFPLMTIVVEQIALLALININQYYICILVHTQELHTFHFNVTDKFRTTQNSNYIA